MDMSDYKDPLPTELEQIVDEARREAGQGPAPRSPEQGIADMKARIEYHTGLKAKLDAQLKESDLPYTNDVIRGHIASCERQLTEARARLHDFELLARSQN